MTTTAAPRETAPPDLADLPYGRAGIWWFLASEIMTFGGLLGAYVLSRIANGGWAEEMTHLNANIAAFNTLLLVTSSLSIVQAHHAVHAGNRARARNFLWITVVLGLWFLGNKGWEYSIEIHHGYVPATSLFWSFYYTMTGLHALHVLGGIVWNAMMAIAASRAIWPEVSHRVEYAGLYWHFVDVVWIFLFPLLYLS
jgi:heme/copper-type cytochrome/quinol oxidase subunit 3